MASQGLKRYVLSFPPVVVTVNLQAEQTWTGIPVATTQGEQSYIKGNTKFMAVAVQVQIRGGCLTFLMASICTTSQKANSAVLGGGGRGKGHFDFNWSDVIDCRTFADPARDPAVVTR